MPDMPVGRLSSGWDLFKYMTESLFFTKSPALKVHCSNLSLEMSHFRIAFTQC